MYCSLKMSLCSTFRLFCVTTIVLSILDIHAAFTVRRTTSGSDSYDLTREESVVLEVKHDLKRPNDVPIDLFKTTNVNIPSHGAETTQNTLQNIIMTPSSGVLAGTEVSTNESTDRTTEILQPVPESTTRFSEFTENSDIKTEESTLTTSNAFTSSSVSSNSFMDSVTTMQETKEINIYEVTPPFWKKYTTIERIRATTTTPIALLSDEAASSNRIESVGKVEKKHSGVSLQDASDIGSLEQLKIELLLTTMKQQAAEKQLTTALFTEDTITDEPGNSTLNILASSTSTESSSSHSIPRYTVESKRAGYLDFSPKTVSEKSTVTAESDYKNDEKDPLRAMFEVENETDAPDEKTEYRVESQSQLSEDALKEELLKEDILIDNAENAKRFRNENLTTQENNLASEIRTYKSQDSGKNSSSLDDKLKVKPINMNTEKNAALYPVNPNYRPLKKIDVQPPKVFLRDPDDNTWRNESLSSLGIVFKPKNSSKPFTQVLKNKTESEWNNLSEKDNKSETPDLKERLQKIAEMRKSKKKKIDSFGNVVYFDYEENTGSGESVSLSKENVNKTIYETTPFDLNFVNLSSVSSDEPAEITTTSRIEAAFAKEFRVSSTEKPKKFFNVPEYYDNTDDDDIDYLNMAKIDIKKFTTSKMTSPSLTTQTWPRLEFEERTTHSIFPDRKATVQYFPPLKTQKPNINDYDNNFKIKLNSYTTESDEPKKVLPVSSSTTSTMTPEPRTTIQYNNDESNRNDFSGKPNFVKDLYLTRSPMTTDAFTSPGDGGDGYVIKHFRDFVNQAAKDAEYDRIDYSPFTNVPAQGVTKTELDRYDKEKTKINMGDDYDEEAQFRKDVLQRFVNNFNHNSHRFKSDFPVLFNSTVIHGNVHNGRGVASSRAFMRGLYENGLKPKARACDPHCDTLTVELSPAYELHYYVPEQEERQEARMPPRD